MFKAIRFNDDTGIKLTLLSTSKENHSHCLTQAEQGGSCRLVHVSPKQRQTVDESANQCFLDYFPRRTFFYPN